MSSCERILGYKTWLHYIKNWEDDEVLPHKENECFLYRQKWSLCTETDKLLCKSIKIHLYINVYPEQGLMCVCVLKDPWYSPTCRCDHTRSGDHISEIIRDDLTLHMHRAVRSFHHHATYLHPSQIHFHSGVKFYFKGCFTVIPHTKARI